MLESFKRAKRHAGHENLHRFSLLFLGVDYGDFVDILVNEFPESLKMQRLKKSAHVFFASEAFYLHF